MLTSAQTTLILSTAPILKAHGETLTKHFYERLFKHNPELKAIFNQGHQKAGTQQQALAMAVAAYAENIENPTVLMPVLKMVAGKHASLGIRAEHYPIVGKHLLASICEVLDQDPNSDLITAWGVAYGQLADLLIQMESTLYAASTQQESGWSGWRNVKIIKKEAESDEITSFYFAPTDGGKLPSYLAGQYISIKIFVPELGMMQPRQYTLSQAPQSDCYRISVKREAANLTPAGMVSNRLHDAFEVGSLLEITAPQGEFYLKPNHDTPLILISAGVGVTPMIAIAEAALSQRPDTRQQPIHFIHACRHGGVHAFKDWLAEQKTISNQFNSIIYYETPREQDQQGQDFDVKGRLNLLSHQTQFPHNADYFLCGPIPFIQAQKNTLIESGVDAKNILTEVFGAGFI